MQEIVEAVGALKQALEGLDPGSLPGRQAVELVETLAGVEKVCAATRARAAARVEESGAFQMRGHRSGAPWLARPWAPAKGRRATIETGKAIEGLEATRQAFAAGRISEAQAAGWPKRRRWTPPPKSTCYRPPQMATGAA